MILLGWSEMFFVRFRLIIRDGTEEGKVINTGACSVGKLFQGNMNQNMVHMWSANIPDLSHQPNKSKAMICLPFSGPKYSGLPSPSVLKRTMGIRS
jgi:hypothetical protein